MQVIAKDSYLVVDPKTGKNHYITKGETRSDRDKLVKLAPFAFVTPESMTVQDPPVFTADGES